MRTYALVPRVDAPSSDYPKGRMRDTDATVPVIGTPVTELIYGDIHQFFQKMVGVSGITESNLPDNESNGYQLLEALANFLSGNKITRTDQSASAYVDYTLPIGTSSIDITSRKITSPFDGTFNYIVNNYCNELLIKLTLVSDDGRNCTVNIVHNSVTLITITTSSTITEFHYIKKIGGEWFELNDNKSNPYPALIP